MSETAVKAGMSVERIGRVRTFIQGYIDAGKHFGAEVVVARRRAGSPCTRPLVTRTLNAASSWTRMPFTASFPSARPSPACCRWPRSNAVSFP